MNPFLSFITSFLLFDVVVDIAVEYFDFFDVQLS